MTSPPPDRMHDIQGVAEALRTRMEDNTGSRSQREIVIAGILIALLGLGAWAWSMQESEDINANTPRNAPRQLALTSHADTTSTSWIEQALRASLTAQLEAGSDLRIANQPKVQLNVSQIIPIALARTTPNLSERRGWRLSLDLSGNRPKSDLLQLRYRLSGPNKQLHEGVLTGKSAMLADLATRTSIAIRSTMKLPLPATASMQAAALLVPENAQAHELLTRATQALAGNRFALAADFLEQAVRYEPEHPVVEQALAQAYSGLGYEHRARQYATAAVNHSGQLPREQQLNIQSDLHVLDKSWQQAAEVLGALHLLFPEDLDYGLRLIEVQITAGSFDLAHQTLDKLRKLEGTTGTDPRIDLLAASADYSKGDWSSGLQHANHARSKAATSNNSDLEALALWWINRLDADPDESLIARAEKLFKEAGNTDGQIAAITRRGTRARARGDLKQATGYYDKAITLARASGNESRLSTALGTLAIVKDLQGELRAGLALKEEVLKIRQRRGNQTGIGISLENLGISHYKMGEVEAARRRFEQASSQFARANDLIGTAWEPWHRGRLLVRAGNIQAALTEFENARSNARSKPEGSYQLHADFEWLHMRLFDNPLPGEIASTIEALDALQSKYLAAELRPDAAETLLLKARFQYASGKNAAAIEAAERAHSEFANEGAAYYLLKAATHLLNFGDLSRCEEVLKLASASEHRYLALMGLLALNRCDGVAVDLEAIRQESTKLGLFEPLLLATHLEDPSAAKVLAERHKWPLIP